LGQKMRDSPGAMVRAAVRVTYHWHEGCAAHSIQLRFSTEKLLDFLVWIPDKEGGEVARGEVGRP